MSHKKFGPHRISRFDVYWIQTKKTDRQTDKPNLYIDRVNRVFIFIEYEYIENTELIYLWSMNT